MLKPGDCFGSLAMTTKNKSLSKSNIILSMSNTPPNDDLITEVLNQDPKYVDTRNSHEVDFKQKHKLNSSFGFTPNRFHWFKFRYAIPALCLVIIIGISVFAIQNAKNTAQLASNQLLSSQNKVENSAPSDALIAKAPAPFLPMPGSNEQADNLAMNNIIENSPTLSSGISTNGSTISDIPIGSSQESPKTEADKKATNLNLKTTVRSDDGSDITFSYDQNTGNISYVGTVIGGDACTFLDSADLEKQNTSFILKYKLKRTGEICAQMIKEIPITGSLNVKLDELQLVTFDSIFSVLKIN
jgi:hypothetical protein